MVLKLELKKCMLLPVKLGYMCSLLVTSRFLRMEEKKVERKTVKWSTFSFHHYVKRIKIPLQLELR